MSMTAKTNTVIDPANARADDPAQTRIAWYSPGQSCTVEINGAQVTVRFVGRKGRRARIAILASAEAQFRDGPVNAPGTNGASRHG